MPKVLDLTNQKFNRLTVIKPMLERTIDNKPQWLCKCDCGKFIMVTASGLRSGNNKSCGCLHRELVIKRNKENATHGFSRTPIYQTWGGMITRCYNEKDMHYEDYGARGIKVCDRWRNSFENFLADMGEKPSKQHSLERKDVNGDYEPNNCIWATPKTQSNNRRNNTKYIYKGEELTSSQLAEKYKLNLSMLDYRLRRNWPIDLAIETPSRKDNWHGHHFNPTN